MDTGKNFDWQVIRGTLSHFQWSEGNENLMEKIQERSAQRNALAGAASAALGMYGTLATAAMVAAYDGEYTENLACAIDGKVVCGRFCGARKLQDGDDVRIVVSPLENGVFFAQAVQRCADELLWLPNQVFCGDNAALKDAFKSVKFASFFSWIFIAIIFTIGNSIADNGFTFPQVAGFLFLFALGLPLMVLAVTFFPSRTGKEFGEIGSRIFALLEFPDPDNLNMEDARLAFQSDEPQVTDIYKYRLALDAHMNGTRIPTKYGKVATEA